MYDPRLDPPPDDQPRVQTDSTLFAWHHRSVVLLAMPEGERWVVARGWRAGDRLAHVRRWTFPSATGLIRQLRRLVSEAGGDAHHAAWVAAEALGWVADCVPPTPAAPGHLSHDAAERSALE